MPPGQPSRGERHRSARSAAESFRLRLADSRAPGPGADVGQSRRRCGPVPVYNGVVCPHLQVVVDDDVVPRSNLHSLTALHNSLISMCVRARVRAFACSVLSFECVRECGRTRSGQFAACSMERDPGSMQSPTYTERVATFEACKTKHQPPRMPCTAPQPHCIATLHECAFIRPFTNVAVCSPVADLLRKEVDAAMPGLTSALRLPPVPCSGTT